MNGDVRGVHIARLKLSDGKNYYDGIEAFYLKISAFLPFRLGFVIDMSILDSLHINVYAVVRIEKLMVLNDSPGK